MGNQFCKVSDTHYIIDPDATDDHGNVSHVGSIDWAASQLALTDHGGVIELVPGTYNVQGTIIMGNYAAGKNVSLIGAGPSTLIRKYHTANESCISCSGRGFSIRDFRTDSVTLNPGSIGSARFISISTGYAITIDNLVMNNNSFFGIYISGVSSGHVIKNCIINSPYSSAIVSESNYTKILHNIVRFTGGVGSDTGMIRAHGDHSIIRGNRVHISNSNQCYGIGAGYGTGDYMTISGNSVIVMDSTSGSQYGLIYLSSSDYSLVTSNICSGNQYTELSGSGSGILVSLCSRAQVKNNVCINNYEFGIWANSSYSAYAQNIFYNNGAGDTFGTGSTNVLE